MPAIYQNRSAYNDQGQRNGCSYNNCIILINDFLQSKDLKIKDISTFYLNTGPGSFAGIRNSISVVKAICLVNNVDYYCYDFQYFKDIELGWLFQ